MRFTPETCRCPDCGDPPRGTVDLIPGVALFGGEEDGEYDYSGTTDVCWDGQYTVTLPDDPPESLRLVCRAGHEWLGMMVEEATP